MNWTSTEWMLPSRKWARDARYWKTVPHGPMALLVTGIFFLFASFGLLMTIISVVAVPVSSAMILAALCGLYAVGLAYAGFRANLKLMLVVIAVQIVSLFLYARFMGASAPLSSSARDFAILQHRLSIEGWLALAFMLLAYILITMFIQREGQRVFGPIAEMKLATEVHRALVPSFSRLVGGFEICGASMPSGEMGGDLVDIIEEGPRWIAYLADVSGHGVPAGMIMAMVKSATRMGATADITPSTLLCNLNRVLASSCAPNTFVTFACIAGGADSSLQFSLAGHLPILRYRKRLGTVEEHSVPNLPLGVLPDAKFEAAGIECEPGDILVVLTDGMTEVSDAHGQELGMEPLKSVLLLSADAPLEKIMMALRARSLQHGKQLDDQSLLLLRRC